MLYTSIYFRLYMRIFHMFRNFGYYLLRQILEWQRDMSDNREFLSLLKGDLDLFAIPKSDAASST